MEGLTPTEQAWILGAIELRRQADLGVLNMDAIIALETNSREHASPTQEDLNNLTIKVLAL